MVTSTIRNDGVTAVKKNLLLGVDETDAFVLRVALGGVVLHVLLVYSERFVPEEYHVYLVGPERDAAILVLVAMFVSIMFPLLQFFVGWNDSVPSGVLKTSCIVNLVSMAANYRLAFTASPVMLDPVTGARVFFARWSEWIPLSGVMTFLSEAIDLPSDSAGIWRAVFYGACQTLSCIFGIIFPFCPNLLTWVIAMTLSFLFYFVVFVRLRVKRNRFLATSQGTSNAEYEEFERRRYAYLLMLQCSIIWTVLVVFYFINMALIYLLPEGHLLRHESMAMIFDTVFDFIAKSMYMRLIVEIHVQVFDAEGRARRQLGELRRLMSVLWESSSDVIVISVRNANVVSTMLSSSFVNLIGGKMPMKWDQGTSIAFMVDSYVQDEDDNNSLETKNACFVDSNKIFDGRRLTESVVSDLEVDTSMVDLASRMVKDIWKRGTRDDDPDKLSVMSFSRVDGEPIKCEMKISRNNDSALISVVRDVTERYKRFEAERRAHTEAIARQRDAQSVNRFTRHEVKNGLLAGIELCDRLRDAFSEVETNVKKSMSEESAPPQIEQEESTNETVDVSKPKQRIDELDDALHEILETVLAEAMARDVIHEVYQPRLERLEVRALLTNSIWDIGTDERFPLEVNRDDMPYVMVDPQLIRYIHRNAMSNALKYGKLGGQVTTKVNFDDKKQELTIQVVNEPGANHDVLLELGEEANALVFEQNSRLHKKFDAENHRISSGDGAWIMQKCARTMGGYCDIEFSETKTTFTFVCPASPLAACDWPDAARFEVPPDTWGVGVDDSKIQRRHMSRILAYAGVDAKRRVILGSSVNEIRDLEQTIVTILNSSPNSKMLLLMDENLDYRSKEEEHALLSGSMVMKAILENLHPSQVCRLFVLIRSANDSANDIKTYVERTHGFFPKAPMKEERVREILGPLWAERFRFDDRSSSDDVEYSIRTDDEGRLKDDLFQSLAVVDKILRGKNADEMPWSKLWSSLHSLKGDLMVVEDSDDLEKAVSMISSMRGSDRPKNFREQWEAARKVIVRGLDAIEE